MQILSAKQKIAAGLYAKQAIEAVLGDSNLIQKACEQNPWFTHYYIQKAGHALLQWMEEKAIVDFLNRYLTKKNSSKNVAVIMAANLPFVGFQDLFQVFLSGNICLYQFSSRDSVLMRAIVTEWKIRSTDIESFIVPFQKNSEVDFVVATGSDNTARYTDFKFRDVPRLIRKNRFSIAALSGEETKIDLEGLASDILLYNGMGCRNVSNLLVPKNYDLTLLTGILDDYPDEKLSDAWRERMKWESAIAKMLPLKSLILKNSIISYSKELKDVPPGYLNIVECASSSEMKSLTHLYRDKIQCIVGSDEEVQFGMSQQPELSDFADGVDLIREIEKN